MLSSLSRALIFSGGIEEAMRVNAQAVAMARRLGDPATLRARCARVSCALAAGAVRGADGRPRSRRCGSRSEAVTVSASSRLRAGGCSTSWSSATSRCVPRVSNTTRLEADELRQPFYQYIGLSSQSMLALFEGRFEEAERWAHQALAFGARMPSLDAAGVYGVHMFSIRREQGRLKELAPLVAHFVRTTPQAARGAGARDYLHRARNEG